MKSFFLAFALGICSAAHATVGAMNYNADSDPVSGPASPLLIIAVIVMFAWWLRERR